MTSAKPIERHRTFTKHYEERIAPNAKLAKQFDRRLRQFLGGRTDLVKDHPLTEILKGKRSFSITGDIRVIYADSGLAYVFVYDIGTHNQVYR
ncbi:hypothetical protein HY375_04005 [Candidatus Berkelbacteria bacterium]|nr:hypothetical protein [Candidatus Berkelbacteria bacterium]